MGLTYAVTIFAFVALLGRTSYAGYCNSYKNCSECTSIHGCVWVLLHDCSEACLEENYTFSFHKDGVNVTWRKVTPYKSECPHKEECKIMDENVLNPSFENWYWREYSEEEKRENPMERGTTVHNPWSFSPDNIATNMTLKDISTNRPFLAPFSGKFYLLFGRFINTDAKTFEVKSSNNVLIDKEATHLSFFYVLRSNSYRSLPAHRAALKIYIDYECILDMENYAVVENLYRESEVIYRPMTINITRFADGGVHSLKFYFDTGATIVDNQYRVAELVLIDYIQIIKSNLVGSSFDIWEERTPSKTAMCAEPCREELIGNRVCNPECMKSECRFDGGDCHVPEEKDSSNVTIGVIIVIIIVIIGAIVLGVFIPIMVRMDKKRGKEGKQENQDIEMGSKKHHKKGWSVSTKNIMFGGKEASIGIALKDTFTVTNTGKPRTFSVGLFDEARCNSDMKFKITINPKEFYLEKNEEQLVNIFVKIFCTTTISERIEVKYKEEPEDGEVINLVAQGKNSTRINPYDLKLGNAIGEGSFGVVYSGVYKKTFNVAVKRLKVVEEDTIESFNKEADILEKVHSDYTVKFYGALVTDEYYCFVTEFAQFGSLSSLLPKIIPGDPNGGKRMLIALNIAKALKYLHENNILHRDLKPENVLVSSNIVTAEENCVVCKLTDFGSSKVLHSKEEENMTKMLGTPSYMAPEVINTDSYGKESDIYSLGASFIELWSGKQPLEDLDLQFYTFIRKIASGELKLVFAPGPSEAPCPREVEELINRCLDRELVNRPPIDEIISVLSNTWMSLYPGIKDFNLF